MLQFMGDNKRLIHFHEQKLSDLEAFKSDTQVFQKNTSASLKKLETQVGQLTLNMPNQSKGTFSSDTQKNPKHFMAVQLRSGQQQKERKGKKRLRQNKKRLERKERRAYRLNNLKEVMSRNRRKEYQLIHL